MIFVALNIVKYVYCVTFSEKNIDHLSIEEAVEIMQNLRTQTNVLRPLIS